MFCEEKLGIVFSMSSSKLRYFLTWAILTVSVLAAPGLAVSIFMEIASAVSLRFVIVFTVALVLFASFLLAIALTTVFWTNDHTKKLFDWATRKNKEILFIFLPFTFFPRGLLLDSNVKLATVQRLYNKKLSLDRETSLVDVKRQAFVREVFEAGFCDNCQGTALQLVQNSYPGWLNDLVKTVQSVTGCDICSVFKGTRKFWLSSTR